MDDLDYQNVEIRRRAKREFIKGVIGFCIGAILTIGSYTSAKSGSHYVITYGLIVWGFYKMFIASKFYILGRHAISFPKPKTGKTSDVIRGKIYKHKD